MSPTPEPVRVSTPTGTIAGLAWGPADAPLVVAGHGWLDNAASFTAIAPHLPGLRLVAIDWPGHGRSDHLPPGASYPFVDWIASLHAVVTSLSDGPVRLLGHSMGAAISSMFAGTFVDLVACVVAIEGIGPLAEPATEAPARLQKAIETGGATRPRSIGDLEPTLDKFASARGLTRAQAQPLAERSIDAQGSTWSYDPRLRESSRWRMTEDMVMAYLGRIAAPLLAVRGKSGSPFAPGAKSPRFRAVADARLVELDGGHHLHISHAEAVAAAIGPFLRGETT